LQKKKAGGKAGGTKTKKPKDEEPKEAETAVYAIFGITLIIGH
jgi:hypothetical protein